MHSPVHNFSCAKATFNPKFPYLGARQPCARVQHLCDGCELLQRQQSLPGMATSTGWGHPQATKSC